MKRRHFVSTVIGATTIGTSGCAELNSVLGNGYVDEISWSESGVATITIQEDHDSDGFAILHEHHSDPTKSSIVRGETPDFSGPLEIPLINLFRNENVTFPTPAFVMQFWKGEFSNWNSDFGFNFYDEKLGDYKFEVPEAHRSASLFE